MTVNFDAAQIKSALLQRRDERTASLKHVETASLATDETVAVEQLNRMIRKEDFKRMEVLGQFNLGFIVVRLKNDLFIIDQHAR